MSPGLRHPGGGGAEGTRYLTPDALRGFAIVGMLVANMVSFAFPADAPGFWAASGSLTPELVIVLLISIFVSGKFYGLFALLFGMGLALQSDRARCRGLAFVTMFTRRLVILFFIGITHAVLLWWGDILGFYALIGFAALPLRNLRPRTLLATSVILLALSPAVLTFTGVFFPGFMPDAWQDWEGRAERGGVYELLADEARVFQTGTWEEMIRYRLGMYVLATMPVKLLFVTWNTLGLFLLGIFFARRGTFFDAPEQRPIHTALFRWGFLLGVPLQLVSLAAAAAGSGNPLVSAIHLFSAFAGNTLLTFAYAGTVARLCTAVARRRLQPLAALGRMALTNYLGQSFLCGLLFYSYGLALFGRLDLLHAELLVPVILIVQVALCSVWLRHFRTGPMEGLWRSLARSHRQPLPG